MKTAADATRATPLPTLTGSRSPIRFFTTTVFLMAAMLIFSGWHIYRSYQINKEAIERDFRLKELAVTIAYLNQMLTMSVRMAAVTGDPQWETHYHRFKPKQEAAIAEAKRFAPVAPNENTASQVDAVNQQLMEMQRQALEFVRQGRLAEAQALVLGQEYEAQQWMSNQEMERFSARLLQRVEANQSAERTRTALSITVIVAALVLSLILWTIVLRVIRQWQVALIENNRRLELALAQLRDLNKTLDQKVTERTAELQTRNEEFAKQHEAMRSLFQELQSSQTAMTAHNEELARRESVMQSLLEDLNTAKERIEQQAATLQAANTKLKELAVLKDEFVAKVSHELRTPLTSVKEGLSLLLDNALGKINADQRDFVTTMDGDIDRLAELINNMLDVSKIEAGRMRLTRGRVQLPQLIESLARSYHAIMGHRTLSSEIAPSLPPVFGDANRLVQILTNLLSNAIKFTPDDGRITFRLSCRNDLVAVAVEDNGAGVAADDLPKLFRKFSQVGSSAAAAGAPRGTGLGLVVCKELAELHGGTIEVASTLGQGTTFTVLLPAYSEPIALTESFREQLELASSEDGQMASLIAVQASALVDPQQPPAKRRQPLEQLAQDVRQHLHRGDTVVTLEPSWIVAMAVTEPSGLQAIVRRLRENVRDGHQLLFGVAVHPQDGMDAASLFKHAASQLNQGPAQVQPAGSKTPS